MFQIRRPGAPPGCSFRPPAVACAPSLVRQNRPGLEYQAKLQLSAASANAGPGDLLRADLLPVAVGGVPAIRLTHTGRALQTSAGISEGWMVECIGGGATELEPDPLPGKQELLEHREIHRVGSRPVQAVSPDIAEGSVCRLREGSRIEPLVEAAGLRAGACLAFCGPVRWFWTDSRNPVGEGRPRQLIGILSPKHRVRSAC